MKANQKKIILILFLLFVVLVLSASPVLSITVGEIMQELTCTCGCNMVSSSCEGAMECTAAGQIKSLVQERIKKGESKEAIIKYFVSAYGEKILSAPTKKGFNLTAWIIPFFALVIGGGVIYIILLKWFSRGEQSSGKDGVDGGQVEEKYLERVMDELRNFDY